LLAFGGNVVDGGGDEVVGFEDLEVTSGGVVALGAVDDGLGGGVPGDFLEGEGMAEEILGQAFTAGGVVGGHGFFAAVVDIEAGVFPGEEVGEFAGADEFGIAQGVKEAVAEEFDGGREVFGGHAVEAAVGGEESIGGKDMEVRVEDEVVAEGVDSGDRSDAAVGEAEAGAEGVLEGGGGGVEQVGEEVAAFAEDAAQDLGDGEDELAVGDFVADGGGDPFANGASATLVACGADDGGALWLVDVDVFGADGKQYVEVARFFLDLFTDFFSDASPFFRICLHVAGNLLSLLGLFGAEFFARL
jgi:hypothetical protein